MLVGYVPAMASFLWLHVMGVIHQMAKMPQPIISPGFVDLIGLAIGLGTCVGLYRLWADFVRGDYYLDLALWRDQYV